MEIKDFKQGDEVAILELFEIVFKKPMSKKVEQALMVASIGLLLLLMAFVTLQDILRLI